MLYEYFFNLYHTVCSTPATIQLLCVIVYLPYLDETMPITVLKIDRDFGFSASREKFTYYDK